MPKCTININSRYCRTRPTGISFKGYPSKTKQSFAKEADINNIMLQYVQTGVMPSGNNVPQFGDFSSSDEYADHLNKIIQARDDFSTLSSDLRKRFNNDPQFLIKFLEDPANHEEAIELGLMPDPDYKAPEPPPTPVFVTNTNEPENSGE